MYVLFVEGLSDSIHIIPFATAIIRKSFFTAVVFLTTDDTPTKFFFLLVFRRPFKISFTGFFLIFNKARTRGLRAN